MVIWAGISGYNQFSIGRWSYVIQHFVFLLFLGRGIGREARQVAMADAISS